jgi:hypothetical protein
MNMDQALSIAASAMAELEAILFDMKKDGIVEILIAGASGAAGEDHSADVGVHLSVPASEARVHIEEILKRSKPLRDGGVAVVVFPKPPGQR